MKQPSRTRHWGEIVMSVSCSGLGVVDEDWPVLNTGHASRVKIGHGLYDLILQYTYNEGVTKDLMAKTGRPTKVVSTCAPCIR